MIVVNLYAGSFQQCEFEFVGTLLPTNWCKNAILLRFGFAPPPFHTSIRHLEFALCACSEWVFVILGAISANLSFWQIGNRRRCGTCAYTVCGICLCVLLFMFIVDVLVALFLPLDCRWSRRKTIRHKKERE